MTRASKITLCALAAVCIAPLAAQAADKEYVGRTGLPTVREGKNEVWLERGLVTLKVDGDKLRITHTYRFKYPGAPTETGSEKVKMAIREDYFRDKSNGPIDPSTATTTFDSYSITVDDQTVNDEADSWVHNDKKDTATRWHNWWMTFNPGESHTVRIETVAPLGWDGVNRYVHFVTKDLGGLRKDPDYVEIRFEGPDNARPVLAGLEPKPSDRSQQAARWVYRKSNPSRDIMIKLPASYRPIGSAGL
jgi:hypothetical protein